MSRFDTVCSMLWPVVGSKVVGDSDHFAYGFSMPFVASDGVVVSLDAGILAGPTPRSVSCPHHTRPATANSDECCIVSRSSDPPPPPPHSRGGGLVVCIV